MKVTYKISKNEFFTELYKKHVKSLLDKVEKEGAKKVRVSIGTSTERRIKPYTGVEVNFFSLFSRVIEVVWVDNGLIHRTDGPAMEEYSITHEDIECIYKHFYYKGERCIVFLNNSSFINHLTSLDRIVLDYEKLTENIYLYTVLSTNKIEKIYCWFMNEF